MFQLLYVGNELRRRLGRTVLTALGLAAGVGLVIGIIGVSQGLDDAQQKVLAPLNSIGTDILVTRVAGSQTAAGGTAAATPAPAQGQQRQGQGPAGGGNFFSGGGPGGGPNQLNEADTAALLAENSNVVTDLAKLGTPGDKFTRDFFLSATFLSFPQDAVSQVAAVDGVTSAVGGLSLIASHQTGTVPQIVAELQTGGETVTQTVRPDPMTEAESSAFEQCAQQQGGGGLQGAPGGGGGGGGGRAFASCLPQRFREFRASFTTPLRTIRQAVNPPSTDITSTSYTAAGVDPAHPDAGLVTSKQLSSGRWISSETEVLLNVAYANKNSLKAGSELPINGTTFTVAGLVSPTLTGNTADVYFPLAALQKLASKESRITQILVRVKDSGSVDAVAARIGNVLPGAEVVTTKALADQVTGSLADAQNLVSSLGGALGAIVLAAAFAIAVLLTLSSVGKRVREIGTLRAIGWPKARVVRQIVAETLGIGVLGGLLGIVVGIGVAVAVGALSPTLTATSTGVPGLGSSPLAGLFGQAAQAATTTTTKLSASLSPVTLLLGVGFAVLGGLLAGVVGGWRAARLSPAAALTNLG